MSQSGPRGRRRHYGRDDLKLYQFRIQAHVYDALEEEAHRNDQDTSQLLRRVLQEWVDEHFGAFSSKVTRQERDDDDDAME